jgi:putative membrane protein
MAQAPDPRVLFAAERTLLAWVRSSISVTALGFVVAKFALLLESLQLRPAATGHHWLAVAIGIGLVAAGIAMSLLGAVQYRVALRNVPPADVPPGYRPHAVEVVAYSLAALGILLALYLAAA